MKINEQSEIIENDADNPYIASWFQPREFPCNCCGVIKIDKTFLMKLDEARTIAGVPFIITSKSESKRLSSPG